MENEPESSAEYSARAIAEKYRKDVEYRAEKLFLPYDHSYKDTTGYQLVVQIVDGRPTEKAHVNKVDTTSGNELTLSEKGYYKVNLRTGVCDCFHYKKHMYCKHSLAVKWWPANYHHELILSSNGKYATVVFKERKVRA